MQTSLIIESIDPNNKKNQKTATFVNAESSGAQLDSLARQLNALTNNTYVGATRVDKTTLGAKIAPTLTLKDTSIPYSEVVLICTGNSEPYAYETTVNYNGDGILSLQITESKTGAFVARLFKADNGEYKLRIVTSLNDSESGTFTINASEGDTYAAASVEFKVLNY